MRSIFVAAVLALGAAVASADTIYFGFEDTPTGDRDYNDKFGTITGSSLHTSIGVFAPLTAAIINDDGLPFWDHVSGDGPNLNIGNIWMGEYPGTQYLATPGGGLVSDVWFSGGSTVTITGGITADSDTIKVCYVASCSSTMQVVAGSLTWIPTQAWEIVGVVAVGGTYYSDPNEDHKSSFAFATGGNVPEPGALGFVAAGLGLIMFARARHWRASR